MRCPSCNFDNPNGMRFCGQCGAQIDTHCPQCSFENPSGFRFCGSCGSSLLTVPHSQIPSSKFQAQSFQSLAPHSRFLDSGLRPSDPRGWTPPHLAERIRAATFTDGERKTLTALFADLKGSTALIEGLDPEEARAILDPALQVMMDAVHQYDGYVAQALGDGIFALFGAPLAHEDHPQRALYAALRMQEAMRRYADTLRAPRLNLRAVHTVHS